MKQGDDEGRGKKGSKEWASKRMEGTGVGDLGQHANLGYTWGAASLMPARAPARCGGVLERASDVG